MVAALQDLGIEPTLEEVERQFESIDGNDDDKISFEEFRDFMKKNVLGL